MGKVFISYRRKDANFAYLLAEKLEERIDGKIFIDRDIDEDNFKDALSRQLRECNVFVLALTENTFEASRICQPDDWIRFEIASAIKLQKPIALAMHNGQPPPPPEELPDDLHEISFKQGIVIYPSYFDECSDRLAKHCINISNQGLKPRKKVENNSQAVASTANTATGGDNSVQFVGSTIENSTIITSIGTDEKQKALAEIDQLQKQETLLQRQINALSYKGREEFSVEGAVWKGALLLTVLAIGFAVDPAIGVVVMVGLGIFIWNMAQGQPDNSAKIAELQKRISVIRSKIVDMQEIADRRR